MSQQRIVTYGPGGYDPRHPGGNVVSEELVEVPDAPPSDAERLDALAVAALWQPV